MGNDPPGFIKILEMKNQLLRIAVWTGGLDEFNGLEDGYRVIFFTIFEFVNIRIEGGRTEKEIVNESANPSRIRMIRNSPYIFCCAHQMGNKISFVDLV